MIETRKFKVVFLPDSKEAEVAEGENLLRAAMLAEVHINASCGGDGTCGKCRVIVEQGKVESQSSPKLSKEDLDKGYVLACRSFVKSDLLVRVPPESILGEKKVLDRKRKVSTCGAFLSPEDTRDLVKGWEFKPAAHRLFLKLPPPTLEDNLSDLERVKRGLSQQYGVSDFRVSFPVLKDLAKNLREKNWEATATLLSYKERLKLIQVLAGDWTHSNLGVIVDIGTTTVYAQLLNLITGEIIAESSDYNAQVSCGEDVITRIIYSLKDNNLTKLQKLVVATVNSLIADLLKKSDCLTSDITHIVAAGNTTMTHLFLGLSPRHIREEPYIPTTSFAPLVRAREIGLDVDEGVYVYTFPCRASYVGGDIVSGVLGSGIFQTDKLTLYIDVGTNGELVLGNSEWLLACSCSAGPAFEGGTIKHGMRATTGAIESVRISRDTFEPMILTIGQTKPKGICGSGLIDAVAELFLSRVIDPKGKFNLDIKTPRIRETEHGVEYVLAWAEETMINQDIVLTEVDIENLIRTKGAIYAGVATLLDSVNMAIDEIEQVFVAGGFGHYLELDKAIIIGLLPEISCEKVKFVGNGSLLGARLVILSQDMERAAEEIAEKLTYLELSVHSGFMDKFISTLFLPHTNIEKFPSVMAALRQSKANNTTLTD